MPENDYNYILKLFEFQNEQIKTLQEKIDKLSNSFSFYIGIASTIASLISIAFSKLF